MKILAVDDDPGFLQLLKAVLADAGYDRVETACDADEAEALIAAVKEPYDCFLLDIQMPGPSGIDLCGRIRRLPEYCITPILMLTAMLDESSIDLAFKSGATDYVTKPIKGLELGARIRTARLISEQTRKSVGLEESAAQLSARLDNLMRARISEPLEIKGVPACVSQRDLEHLLSLLPRSIFAIETFALRLEGVAEIWKAMSGEEYAAFLAEIATNISSKLVPSQHYITYTGDGVFGCVVLGSGRRSFDLKCDEPEYWNTHTEALGGEPRLVELKLSTIRRKKLETGTNCVDTLRCAIARATEDRLMNRLQRELNRSRFREGVIVPRRPRLGVARRFPRPSTDVTLESFEVE